MQDNKEQVGVRPLAQGCLQVDCRSWVSNPVAVLFCERGSSGGSAINVPGIQLDCSSILQEHICYQCYQPIKRLLLQIFLSRKMQCTAMNVKGIQERKDNKLTSIHFIRMMAICLSH